jgi:aspartyl-tRNA(Asn)/glutamyl-tRNA(Gln) amidotransferase subunit C
MTIADVKHLAKLSALSVSEDQAKKLESQFADTLEVVNKLADIDTGTVIPTSQVTGQINRFREDLIDPARILSHKEALSNAHHTFQGFFLVPAVFDSKLS